MANGNIPLINVTIGRCVFRCKTASGFNSQNFLSLKNRCCKICSRLVWVEGFCSVHRSLPRHGELLPSCFLLYLELAVNRREALSCKLNSILFLLINAEEVSANFPKTRMGNIALVQSHLVILSRPWLLSLFYLPDEFFTLCFPFMLFDWVSF